MAYEKWNLELVPRNYLRLESLSCMILLRNREVIPGIVSLQHELQGYRIMGDLFRQYCDS